MEQQIKIEGMTCDGCRQNVENALLGIEGVTGAKVSLEPPQAVLETWHAIRVEQVESALSRAGNYKLAGRKAPEGTEKAGGSCCG